jgi:hypothetical protein
MVSKDVNNFSDAYKRAKKEYFPNLKDAEVTSKLNKIINDGESNDKELTANAFRQQLSRGLKRKYAVLIEKALGLKVGTIVDSEEVNIVYVFVRCIEKHNHNISKEDMMHEMAKELHNQIKKSQKCDEMDIVVSLLTGEWDIMFKVVFKFTSEISTLTSLCLQHLSCSRAMTCLELKSFTVS